ncbi:hypothetical protein IG631_09159 [Alternaria alternata]|nr:hypothetical protein IG631_09159 [Alternaria alternata]
MTNKHCVCLIWRCRRVRRGETGQKFILLLASGTIDEFAGSLEERAPAWQRRIGSLAHRAFPPRFQLALPHAALWKP